MNGTAVGQGGRVSQDVFEGRRCALLIGHPGHELRVLGWMHRVRPSVAVLTDGSGHEGRSRVELTRQLCARALATPSEVFGLVTDRAIYRALLIGDLPFFLHLADALAAWLIREEISILAGDAIEGYNPTHDLCRVLANRAVRTASRGRRLTTYAFDLTGPPRVPADTAAVSVSLAPAELALKVEACRDYGRRVGGTLLGEIDELLHRHGEVAFAQEYLVPVDAWADVAAPRGYRPYYETHGARQVAAGLYQEVIRYDEHVRPVIGALQS